MDARDVRTAYNSVVNLGDQLSEASKDVAACEHALIDANSPTPDVELLTQHRRAITVCNHAATVHSVAVTNLDAMIKVLTFEQSMRQG